MIERPQTRIKGPRIKAVLFVMAVCATTVLGILRAGEPTVEVVVATKAIPALTVVGNADVARRTAVKDLDRGTVSELAEAVGRVALGNLEADAPVPKGAVVPAPSCSLTTSSAFGLIVVPLRAPAPSSVERGTVVQLRASPDNADPAPRAVFIQTVDPPKTAASDTVAVAYAEMLISLGDAPELGRATAWSLVPAAPSPSP